MKRGAKIYMGFLLFSGLILLCRCSPQAGKSLLTFFFDGVPETDTTLLVANQMSVHADTTGQEVAEASPEEQTLWIHYPYAEKECAACHDEQSLGRMTEPEPGLCYICHEDLSANYEYLHGPVAGGYCSSCHDPHSSDHEKLLRFSGDELCFYCHAENDVYHNEMHEDLDGMACTDCHNPHGGEDQYIFQ
jgi:predicted CXXCH cytochrome family protein